MLACGYPGRIPVPLALLLLLQTAVLARAQGNYEVQAYGAEMVPPGRTQAIMPAIDLNLGPNWEFNLASGIGMTAGTDHLLVKMIVGRRLKLGKR